MTNTLDNNFPESEILLYLINPTLYENLAGEKRTFAMQEFIYNPPNKEHYFRDLTPQEKGKRDYAERMYQGRILKLQGKGRQTLKIIDIKTKKVIYEKDFFPKTTITPEENVKIKIEKLAAGSNKDFALLITIDGLKLSNNGEIIDIETNEEIIENLGNEKNWKVSIV